ncbi:MAG: flagellar hook capping protein [Pseudobutyrivibrio sp.]|nr:flagellar hook capping protein [Pseudobutyrivibrio sp.]
MAIVQEIKNGQVVDNSASQKKTDESTKKNAYDKEMFLKLLVAEMQYQDPLEPTSNTEYVSELASFSQIEAVQAVQGQMSTIQANSLVGKYVILQEDDQYISGKVDYVMTEDNEMFLSVNNKLYSIDTLDSVCDEDYYMGVLNAQTFTDMLKKLPTVYTLTTADEDKIKEARKFYDAMTDGQKQFVSADAITTLQKLEERLQALKDAQSKLDKKPEETTE